MAQWPARTSERMRALYCGAVALGLHSITNTNMSTLRQPIEEAKVHMDPVPSCTHTNYHITCCAYYRVQLLPSFSARYEWRACVSVHGCRFRRRQRASRRRFRCNQASSGTCSSNHNPETHHAARRDQLLAYSSSGCNPNQPLQLYEHKRVPPCFVAHTHFTYAPNRRTVRDHRHDAIPPRHRYRPVSSGCPYCPPGVAGEAPPISPARRRSGPMHVMQSAHRDIAIIACTHSRLRAPRMDGRCY